MGKKAILERRLEHHNDVFADIVNASIAILLKHRRFRKVRPQDLQEAKIWADYESVNDIHEEYRDLAKFWTLKKIVICLLGLENQTKIDPEMSLRTIGYEGGDYRWQLTQEGMEFYPVLTIVIYFGTERRWKKNRTLFERLKPPAALRPLLNDCHVNVVELAWLTDEEAALFKSDFRVVADYLRQVRKNKNYVPSPQVLKHVDETMALLAALSGDRRFVDILPSLKKGEPVTMIDVLGQVESRGEKRGIAVGMERERLATARRMKAMGMTPEQISGATGLAIDEIDALRKPRK